MKRLALLLLVLTLFAPRLAWAVHVTDHQSISEMSVQHAHDEDHGHDQDQDHASVNVDSGEAADGSLDGKDGEDGLAHRHPDTPLLTFTALLPETAAVGLSHIEPVAVYPILLDVISSESFAPPDRPPRTA